MGANGPYGLVGFLGCSVFYWRGQKKYECEFFPRHDRKKIYRTRGGCFLRGFKNDRSKETRIRRTPILQNWVPDHHFRRADRRVSGTKWREQYQTGDMNVIHDECCANDQNDQMVVSAIVEATPGVSRELFWLHKSSEVPIKLTSAWYGIALAENGEIQGKDLNGDWRTRIKLTEVDDRIRRWLGWEKTSNLFFARAQMYHVKLPTGSTSVICYTDLGNRLSWQREG